MELYCGLKGVRFENIEKEIKFGYFISHVSTSDDIQVATRFRNDHGCILPFHPSMRRAFGIFSCDVSWISLFKHEREILFARSFLNFIDDEKTHKEAILWNAKTQYDEHIQQIVRVNEMFNYSIDFNLIYFILKFSKRNMNQVSEYLFKFEKWKWEYNSQKKYKERINL
ncbi:hypothetical protein RFI_10410 [Reticulomyxa filosa]|uniref:Uncharacterized protein n=1 Tax=Reticulomyxa filosa TaxID=46433 RepID=X6NMU3_RETFI|nr:hypothetical protein RFI_10410 [Reticulomyxa filosa]|eukprot:ETO26722.1 hypothetical protein RFI_10410 [Reticulomyxa filosa]